MREKILGTTVNMFGIEKKKRSIKYCVFPIKRIIFKKIILFLIPSRIKHFIASSIKHEYSDYNNISFSQEGEDLVLDRLFEGKTNGFYVDIGAHHPFKYSNTFKFYLKGWNGINIDAMPGSMILFENYRPRDINIEQPISENSQVLPFYFFNVPALNTFDSLQVEQHLKNKDFKITEKRKLETLPLGKVLENYYPEGKLIDFMSIDVEGFDFQVLKSNNWEKFKPLVILIEVLEVKSIIEFQKNEIYKFLISKNYFFYAKTVNTFIFKY